MTALLPCYLQSFNLHGDSWLHQSDCSSVRKCHSNPSFRRDSRQLQPRPRRQRHRPPPTDLGRRFFQFHRPSPPAELFPGFHQLRRKCSPRQRLREDF
ncbi:unnamed protein product [Timema podura]|uniref:Uncharacterized protein n=1 Tax=Timema podura TaxID=61482 RepID=A0ABN7PL83_TIMPD|nr:unnamed protein product [Timema podura]